MGSIDDADAVGTAENAACGDVMHLYWRMANGRVAEVRFQVLGCAPAVAAGSALTEMMDGRTVEALEQIGKEDVEAALGGLPPLKKHCAVLAEDALKAALRDYLNRTQTQTQTRPMPS